MTVDSSRWGVALSTNGRRVSVSSCWSVPSPASISFAPSLPSVPPLGLAITTHRHLLTASLEPPSRQTSHFGHTWSTTIARDWGGFIPCSQVSCRGFASGWAFFFLLLFLPSPPTAINILFLYLLACSPCPHSHRRLRGQPVISVNRVHTTLTLIIFESLFASTLFFFLSSPGFLFLSLLRAA